MRLTTRTIKIGGLSLGGGSPVRIQSMTNTPTADVAATLAQIHSLARAGCEIVRMAIPDISAAEALPEILRKSPVPLVADIHFDYRLALASIRAGIHGLRINPGNIGGECAVREVAREAIKHGTVIRVGSNSGSVKPNLLRENQIRFPDPVRAMAETLVESVMEQCRILEDLGVTNLKVSLKASEVSTTVLACQLFAERSDIPQHIGVTEAGTPKRGIIKSAMGIGSLLLSGIGDTIRVSLTADPVLEVTAAKVILEAAGLRHAAPEVVSCPTCGRCEYDLFALAEKVENLIESEQQSGTVIPFRKIAVMGCAVNGPGEARDADLAVCGATDGKVILCRNGKTLGAWTQETAFAEFVKLLKAGK